MSITLFALAATAIADPPGQYIRCTEGRNAGCVQGFPSLNNTVAYLGLRFAEAPVGNLRFKRPVPTNVVGTKRNPFVADTHKNCYQEREPSPGFIITSGSELDCLTLDIFTPVSTRKKDKLPVMVYIHGGGFQTRNPSEDITHPGPLISQSVAENKNVIVVAISYRLGGLGFLATTEFETEDPNDSTGNYGMLDQIAALHWVQNNIKDFGGDKDRVTLYGESAGAYAICTLLASPLATGLFNAAAMSSTYCKYDYKYKSLAVLSGNLCTTACDGACLRGKSASELYNMPRTCAGGIPGVASDVIPNIDGYFLHGPPVDIIGSSGVPSVPILVGSNRDEMMAFAPQGPSTIRWDHESDVTNRTVTTIGILLASFTGRLPVAPPNPSGQLSALAFVFQSLYSAADFTQRTAAAFNSGLFAVVNTLQFGGLYPFAINADSVSLWTMSGDATFTSSAEAVAGANSGTCARTFRYLWSADATGNQLLAGLGAFHAIELAYLFDSYSLFSNGLQFGDWVPPPSHLAVAVEWRSFMINFINDFDPNGQNVPTWPQWDSNGLYYEFAPGSSGTSSGFRALSVASLKTINDLFIVSAAEPVLAVTPGNGCEAGSKGKGKGEGKANGVQSSSNVNDRKSTTTTATVAAATAGGLVVVCIAVLSYRIRRSRTSSKEFAESQIEEVVFHECKETVVAAEI